MMNFYYIFVILSVFVTVSAVTTFSHGKSIVCNFFSQYMEPKYSMFEDSDATICTHVNCITASYLFSDPFDYENLTLLRRTFADAVRCLDIQSNYPHLKFSFNLNLTSHNYFEVASSPQKRRKFIDDVVNYTHRLQFNGFNLNFDHSQESYQPLQKRHFGFLIKEMREAFESYNLSFTISFTGKMDALKNALDYATIQKYVDFIQFTVEPTYQNNSSITDERISLLKSTTEHLIIELKIPPTKIVIGIRKFCGFEKEVIELANARLHCRYQVNWHEIPGCVEIPTKILEIKNRCIEFESARSVANQVRFLMKRGIAGIMVYALNFYDYFMWPKMSIDTFADFKSSASVTLNIPKQNVDQYPLLNTINEAMLITQNEIYALSFIENARK